MSTPVEFRPALDVAEIRKNFPILARKVHGKPLVYLDNAATTQKPLAVIQALSDFYATDYSNIHRGLHYLSERSTNAYENVRLKVQGLINAAESREIVFVRGTTEAINLVAASYGGPHLDSDGEVIISAMEHHSNIVPWQMVCHETGARLRVIPIDDNGELLIEEFEKLLNSRTRLVAVAHVSNALGTLNPVHAIIERAHDRGVPV